IAGPRLYVAQITDTRTSDAGGTVEVSKATTGRQEPMMPPPTTAPAMTAAVMPATTPLVAAAAQFPSEISSARRSAASPAKTSLTMPIDQSTLISAPVRTSGSCCVASAACTVACTDASSDASAVRQRLVGNTPSVL